MNRTLTRPMFRTGGTAEGITSGLAPRQGYADKGSVKKFDENQMLSDYLRNASIGDVSKLSKEIGYKPRGASMSDFLIDFGLDIASRPPSGSIFATAAAAAKDPFSRYTGAKQSAAEQQYASESDMFKTMIGAQADILASEAEGKAGGKGWLEQWKFDQIPILNDIIRTLEPKRKDETLKPEDLAKLEDAIDQKARIVKLSEVASAWLKTKDGGYAVVDMKDVLLREDLKLPPEDRKYKGKKDLQLTIDAIDAVTRSLQAKGGRVGYQGGNAVMPGATQAKSTGGYDTSGLSGYDTEGGFQPSNLQGFPDQGEEVPEELQNIDYETLRARLPSSITDDSVRLIANSAEAMEDFATIQTQQDINNFNEKYGVELVLPAEA